MKNSIYKLINNYRETNVTKNIYLIGIFLFALKFFLEKNLLITVNDNIIGILLCFCFFQKMIVQKYDKKQLIITAISGILSAFVGFITKEYIVFYCYLALFASQDVKLEYIIKVAFYTLLTLLSLFMIVYIVKIILNYQVPISYRPDGKARYSFYLNHPNMFAGVIFWLTAMYLYVNYDRIKIKHYIIICIINIGAFLLTDSRTSLMAFIVLILLNIIVKRKQEWYKYFKYMAKYSFLFFGVLTILLALIYMCNNKNAIIKIINELFSQRIFLFATSIQKFGISLLPRNIDLTIKVPWESGAIRELYIDSIYARAFIKYGIFYLIYMFYICTNLINKKTTAKEISFIIVFATISTMEKYLIFPVIGFPLFFFKKYLWDEVKMITSINGEEK